MRKPQSALREATHRIGAFCGITLVIVVAVLLINPALIHPSRPLWRWALGFLGTAAAIGLMESIWPWEEVRDITRSREPFWIKGIAVALGLLVSLIVMAVALGLLSLGPES